MAKMTKAQALQARAKKAIKTANYTIAQSEVTNKIIENVTKYPTNLKAAFRLTAKQTKLSLSTIQNMWYGTQGSGGIRAITPVFIIQTTEGIAINTKREKAIKEGPRSLKLAKQLAAITNLSDDEKLALFGIIHGIK